MNSHKPKVLNQIKQAFAFGFLGLSILITLTALLFILSYIIINGIYTVEEKNQSFINLEAPSLAWEDESYTIWVNENINVTYLSLAQLETLYTSSARNWGYISEQRSSVLPLLLDDKGIYAKNLLKFFSSKEEKEFQSRVKVVNTLDEIASLLSENKGAVALIPDSLIVGEDLSKLISEPKIKKINLREFALVSYIENENESEAIHITGEELDSLKEKFTINENGNILKADKLTQEILKENFTPTYTQRNLIEEESSKPIFDKNLISIRNYRYALSQDYLPIIWKEEKRQFSLTWSYFTTPPFDGARFGGISFIIMNTLWFILVTSLISIPLGVSSALYLTYYAKKKSKLSSLIRAAFDVLSSLPAIIFGLFGMTVFVPIFGLGLISGALSTTLMILPNITKASEESIKSVPKDLYQSSLALGATKFTSLWRVVIPYAGPGIITGIILAIGRAFSEAAVLLFTLGTSLTAITSLDTSGRALTVHLYLLLQEGGINKAFPVALVILITVLILNIVADTIRDHLSRKLKY